MSAEASFAPAPPSGPNGRVPHQRPGEGVIIEGNFAVHDTPEAAQQVADEANRARRVGDVATRLADRFEKRTQGTTPEAQEASHDRVAAWFARGQARREASREKWASRAESMKMTFAAVRRIGKLAAPVVSGMVADAAEATANFAKDRLVYGREAAKNMGRSVLDASVAYGHEVAANAHEVRANAAYTVEKFATKRTAKSEAKAKSHEAKLNERAAKVQERRDAVETAIKDERFLRAAKEKVLGRVAAYRTIRSANKMSSKNAEASKRKATQNRWTARTSRHDNNVEYHRRAADERRK